jgi:hypothetical protein
MATRDQVYAAIDSEREHQDALARKIDANPLLDESQFQAVFAIHALLHRMQETWRETVGCPPLDYMRQIAAIAVRTMERHGAPMRDPRDVSKPVHYQPERRATVLQFPTR